jgi:hypothetical protein
MRPTVSEADRSQCGQCNEAATEAGAQGFFIQAGDPPKGEKEVRSITDIFHSYAVFDAQGRHVNGTDKESNHHYGVAYEYLFPDRKAIKLMMEVGVADGSSLLAWREIFPNAHCVGMDIHPASRLVMRPLDRIEFHLGDERVQRDCVQVARGRFFDVIIEDATHRLQDTLCALLYLWPFVRPGGIYVIEEFDNIGSLRGNVVEMWPNVELVDTLSPSGGTEPLVALRKLL